MRTRRRLVAVVLLMAGAAAGLLAFAQGLSGLISGMAAGGVTAALLVQVGQFRTSQAQTVRTMQIELMRMLIHDPDLRPESPSYPGAGAVQRKQAIFTNLLFKYLEVGFETGYFTPEGVKIELSEQFRVPEIRRVWEGARTKYLAGADRKSKRRFVEIVEAAYREPAPAVPVPVAPTRDAPVPMRRVLDAGPGLASGPAPAPAPPPRTADVRAARLDRRRAARVAAAILAVGVGVGAVRAIGKRRTGVRSGGRSGRTPGRP